MRRGVLSLSRILLAWMLAGWALQQMVGQEGSDEGAAQEDEATRRFRVTGFGDSFFEGLKYESKEGEVVELRFVPNRRSRWYVLPKTSGRMTFFSEATDARGRTIRVPEAEVSRIPGATESLFVFLHQGREAGDSGLPYRVIAMDESAEAFGPGDFRFLNLTGALLKGQLGEALFDAAPGLSETIDVSANPSEGFRFRFAVETGAGWRIVHSTRTRADSRYGALYVLKPPLEEGSLRLRVERLW